MNDLVVNHLDKHLSKLQQLERFVGQPGLENNYVIPVIEILLDAARINAEEFLNKTLHYKFWKTIKLLIDEVSKKSEDKYNRTNVCNMALCWFADLAFLIQAECAFEFIAAPSFLIAKSSIHTTQPQRLSTSHRKSFESFTCLRVGDLMRYKADYEQADLLYSASVDLMPSIGDAWNQKGLLATIRDDLLSALYYHYRAIHCKYPFLAATSNIQRILEKYSNEVVVVKSSFEERYLHALSYSHFLFPINREIIESLVMQSSSVERLIPFICVLSELGASDDEMVISNTIDHLVNGIIDSIATKSSRFCQEDLWTLALSLRVCGPTTLQSENISRLVTKLQNDAIPMKDIHHTRFLQCFEDFLPYPANSVDLANMLCSIRDGFQKNRMPAQNKPDLLTKKAIDQETSLKLISTKLDSKEKQLEEEGKDYKSIEQYEDTIQAGTRRIVHVEMDDVIDLPYSSDEESES